MKLACLMLVAVLASGCGGIIADGGDAGATRDGGQSSDAPSKVDVTVMPPVSTVTTFAIRTIHLGEADRNGQPSTTAWKSYGRNVDGLVTTSTSTDVCTLAIGAFKNTQVDGVNGIDNSWGGFFLPVLQTAASLPMPSSTMSAAIQSGQPTLLINVKGLDNDPSQTASPIPGNVYTTVSYGGIPAFNQTTDWPVDSTSLADSSTTMGAALANFTGGSVKNGHFDSGPIAGPITLPITFGNKVSLPVVIHDAVVSFDHTSSTDASNGTLSGVVDTKELIVSLQQLAGAISTSLCGQAFDAIAQQIVEMQDILRDGSNQSGVACSAISIGIGFDAKLVANPTKVATVLPPPNPCP